MREPDWQHGKALLQLLSDAEAGALAVCINGDDRELEFRLPQGADWRLAFSSDAMATAAGRRTGRGCLEYCLSDAWRLRRVYRLALSLVSAVI